MNRDMTVRVEHLSKVYRIGVAEKRHETLAGALAKAVRSPLQNYRALRRLARFDDGETAKATASSTSAGRNGSDVYWALRDVSFEVRRGEAIGIIGRNGAGKSTLLKILSRITEPTAGRATIHGRVASLLEVGTGFHPDLTGRENVYLNGTILGMRKREIDAKFDEIAAFSGVETFLDTPVKRYSSGMRVRLAFAVAAHLDPEILIIDEVLAVGDVEFQQKCMGKMQAVAGQGRTVLFVSHNMHAITSLCQRTLHLKSGEIECDSSSAIAIEHYLRSDSRAHEESYHCPSPPEDAPVYFASASVLEAKEGRLVIRCELCSVAKHRDAMMAVDVADAHGLPVFQAMPSTHPFIAYDTHVRIVTISIDMPLLIPGNYSIDLWIGTHHTETLCYVRDALRFSLLESPMPGRTFPHTKDHGPIVARATAEIL